uniref:Glycosyltransferase n=1 Tax=Kalanchoe fedtschenkoi TaxID=63787 RepID=A0A7N0RB47_KALFE
MAEAGNTVVLYPAPGIGHVVSMVELGKLILRRSPDKTLSVTILLTTGLLDSASLSAYILRVSQSNPSITFVRFPYTKPTSAPISPVAIQFDFIERNAVHVRTALTSITQPAKIHAFVIDFFCPSALPIARQLNLDTFYFFTSGTAVLGMYLYFPTIHRMGFEKSFRELTTTFLDFPGLPPIRASHVPQPLLDSEDPAYAYTIICCEQMAKASGIVVNTFEGFEPDAEKALADGAYLPDTATPPVYYIGPLIADPNEQKSEERVDEETGRVFSWLDQQKDQSVVFLCFGSRGVFSAAQLREMAAGLENSGVRFLWVVKNPERTMTDFDLEALFPAGFLSRTENRGLVVKSWAPQVDILRHTAVGGFVTHCGWNSVLEAVAAGVPMVAWPLYAEQFVNRAVMVESMEMAIGIEEDENGFVSAGELEKKVKELMGSEKGRALRERSLRMKEMSSAALADSGSSTAALMKLLEVWNG